MYRKGLQQVIAPKTETTLDYLPNRVGVFDAANLVLRLLRTNNGVVLRRLLMTAVSAFKLNLFYLKKIFITIIYFLVTMILIPCG